MGDCFRCPRPVSASATEVIAASLVAAAALAVVRQRFFDFFGGVGLVFARAAWSPAARGFFAWPSKFDFLRIPEVRLVPENKGKVRWWFVFTGKFAAKCAPERKKRPNFSRGGAEARRRGKRGRQPQMDADLRRRGRRTPLSRRERPTCGRCPRVRAARFLHP